MWRFLQHIFQLLLSSKEGWIDISEAAKSPETIQRSCFYPWMSIVALSQLLQLFYDDNLTIIAAIESVIMSAAAIFASLYIVRFLLEYILIAKIDKHIQPSKIYTFSIYMVSMLGFFTLLANAIPPSINIINILPFICLLAIHNAASYLNVPSDKTTLYFFSTSAIAWLLPMVFSNLMVNLI